MICGTKFHRQTYGHTLGAISTGIQLKKQLKNRKIEKIKNRNTSLKIINRKTCFECTGKFLSKDVYDSWKLVHNGVLFTNNNKIENNFSNFKKSETTHYTNLHEIQMMLEWRIENPNLHRKSTWNCFQMMHDSWKLVDNCRRSTVNIQIEKNKN